MRGTLRPSPWIQHQFFPSYTRKLSHFTLLSFSFLFFLGQNLAKMAWNAIVRGTTDVSCEPLQPNHHQRSTQIEQRGCYLLTFFFGQAEPWEVLKPDFLLASRPDNCSCFFWHEHFRRVRVRSATPDLQDPDRHISSRVRFLYTSPKAQWSKDSLITKDGCDLGNGLTWPLRTLLWQFSLVHCVGTHKFHSNRNKMWKGNEINEMNGNN